VPGFLYAPRPLIGIFLDAFSARGANYMVKAEPSMLQNSDGKLTDMDRQTETEIAEGLRQGQREAWLTLYDLYAEKVWRHVARLMGGDPASVADIVQETFLAAARSAGHFNPRRGSLWVWLWTIAKRQVALHYRKREQRAALVQAQTWWTSLNGQKDDWLQGEEKPPHEVLESRELAELVRHTLAELPAEYQVLLMAKYIDGAAVEQIADQVKHSRVAVRSKLARARKAFREVFTRLTHRASGRQEVAL
jgi:RNA polymerase sigma-70 factor (ECF subfamily)